MSGYVERGHNRPTNHPWFQPNSSLLVYCNLADQGWGEISQKKRWFHARRNHVEKTSAGRRLFFEMLGTNPNIVKTTTWQQHKSMVQSIFESTQFVLGETFQRLGPSDVLWFEALQKTVSKFESSLDTEWWGQMTLQKRSKKRACHKLALYTVEITYKVSNIKVTCCKKRKVNLTIE